jgi:hypothetical protein
MGLFIPLALLAWVVGFGLASARMAASRDRVAWEWFAFGAVLGPIALALLWIAPPGRCRSCDTPTRGWSRTCWWCGADVASTPASTLEIVARMSGQPAAAGSERPVPQEALGPARLGPARLPRIRQATRAAEPRSESSQEPVPDLAPAVPPAPPIGTTPLTETVADQPLKPLKRPLVPDRNGSTNGTARTTSPAKPAPAPRTKTRPATREIVPPAPREIVPPRPTASQAHPPAVEPEAATESQPAADTAPSPIQATPLSTEAPLLIEATPPPTEATPPPSVPPQPIGTPTPAVTPRTPEWSVRPDRTPSRPPETLPEPQLAPRPPRESPSRSARAEAPATPASPATVEVSTKLLATAVYITGSTRLEAGRRYGIALRGSRLLILGPTDLDAEKVVLDHALDDLDASALEGRLIVSGAVGKSDFVVVFMSVFGSGTEALAATIRSAIQAAHETPSPDA